MDKRFFSLKDLQLIMEREFDNLSWVAESITAVIINDGDAYSVTVNGIELTHAFSIGLRNNLLEISGIRYISGEKYSFTEYFPLNGIWQFGVCTIILPP